MTNRDMLLTPPRELSAADRQKQFELRVELTKVPCAACQEPVDSLEASGTDIDDYRFVKKGDYGCPHCSAELEQVMPPLPFWPGWHWRLKDSWLRRMLSKARAYDRLTRQQKVGATDGA